MGIFVLLILLSLGFLGWGLIQARRSGRAGLLVWLQGALLVLPWLVFLGLFATGLTLDPLALLILLVGTTGGYIWVGRLVRATMREQQEQLRRGTEFDLRPDARSGLEPANTEDDVIVPEQSAIPEADLQTIRGFFGIDTFFVTESFPFRQGVIFKGNLRGKAALIYPVLSEKLQTYFQDRYRLLLVSDEEGKPAVIVVPTDQDPFQPPPINVLVNVGLLVLTVFALVQMSALFMGVDVFTAPERIPETLPIACGVFTVLVVHEIAHYWQAKRYGVKLGLAYPIPLLTPIAVPPLGFVLFPGSFGSFTRFESPAPDRKALFDISLAGPVAGGALALACLVVGLLLSGTTNQTGALVLEPEYLGVSTLVGLLAGLLVGPVSDGQMVALHPLAVVGFLGLYITALTLLPSGKLDGGRIVQAVFGRKTARTTGIITLLLLAAAGIFFPQFLYWAAVLFVLGRAPERPPLDEITETDSRRDILALVALFVMAAVLLPLAPQFAARLGLG
ncbi:MAG: site-2 protease family protein [Gemmatimonadaceae bacterium]|nr:site-2 protease family protein [Gloeobacterales cyanobacterium ES-bin-141]